MTALPRLAVAELAELLRTGRAGDEIGAAVGVPAVALDGTAPPDVVHEAARRAASLPCVLVAGERDWDAVAPLADVCADGDDEAAVAAQSHATPLAAAALVMLLRGGERRTIDEGLVAESSTYSTLQAGPEFAAWLAARGQRTPKETGRPVLRVERDGGTLTLTLDRPHVHNAWSSALRDATSEALQLALADPTVERIELHGEGRSFCSGGDLDEFGSLPDPATAHSVRLARSPGRLVALASDRVTAHLHGACMGAGIELPAFAGRVVARLDAVIALPELALGLVPGAGGTVSLPRRIGRHRTALLALAGKRIDARTAHAWGLVDELR